MAEPLRIPSGEFPTSTTFDGDFDEFAERWCATVRNHWRALNDPRTPMDDVQPMFAVAAPDYVTVMRVPNQWMTSPTAKAALATQVVVPLVRAGAGRIVGLTSSANYVEEGPLRDEIERRLAKTGKMPWWHDVAEETGLPGLREDAVAVVLAADRTALFHATISRFVDAPPLIGKFRQTDPDVELGGNWITPVTAALKEIDQAA